MVRCDNVVHDYEARMTRPALLSLDCKMLVPACDRPAPDLPLISPARAIRPAIPRRGFFVA